MTAVTLCVTMGRRPELLAQTLSTLFQRAQFQHVIAINDFRDEPTNAVFKQLCPQGQLISLDHQLGHHGAVDLLYSQVKTPWVMHCEDDWSFTKDLNFGALANTLTQQPWMSGVCFRSLSDFEISTADQARIRYESHGGLEFYRLDPLHSQWHGYTFNPHFASIELWKRFGPFASFKKERHISRRVRQAGLIMPYLVNGGCVHLGDDQSVSYPKSQERTGLWKWLGWK